MTRKRRLVIWALGLVGGAAFLAGAAAPQVANAFRAAIVAPLLAQDPPVQEPPDPGRGGGPGRGNQAPRPYAQVITGQAKTDDGIFKVHRVGDTLYFEIPQAELGKDFVWNVSLKKTTIGAGFGGQNVSSRVVRWVKRGD